MFDFIIDNNSTRTSSFIEIAKIIDISKPNKAEPKSLNTIIKTFDNGWPRLYPLPIILIPISLPAFKPRNTHVLLIEQYLLLVYKLIE